jgi:hypothetical protein|nr:MAG TPA: hydrogenase formation family protein [Caudoviricetes sp.]
MKVNPRPGCPVCVCEKNGKITLYDPSAWRRAEYRRIHKDELEGKTWQEKSKILRSKATFFH